MYFMPAVCLFLVLPLNKPLPPSSPCPSPSANRSPGGARGGSPTAVAGATPLPDAGCRRPLVVDVDVNLTDTNAPDNDTQEKSASKTNRP